MAKNHISQLHDQFFFTTFSNLDNTRDFLLSELPKELVDAIDFSKMNIEPSTHEESGGHKIYSDFIVKTQLKKESYPADIYILFEHKTKQSSRIFVQLLSYMTAMWRDDQRNGVKKRGKTKYRVIIPVVFYHGPTQWKIATTFTDLFSVDDAVKQYLLNFSYSLFDTNSWNLDDKQHKKLKENIKLFTAMIALKLTYSKAPDALLILMLKLIVEAGLLQVEDGHIVVLTEYTSQALKLDEEKFWSLIEESDLRKEDIMPTVVEVWKQQGRDEGVQQRTIDIAKQMLLEGADVQFVSRVTKLSIKEVQQIRKSLH